QIHYCQYSANPFIYGINLYRIFKKTKPDVVHSHVHAFSGLVLLIAFLSGINNRISHSDSDTRFKEKNISLIRELYFLLMKFLISVFATTRIAVSSLAAENLYGMNWKTKKNCVAIPCGIDISRYDPKYKNANMRNDFGLPEDALVVGHVGRFEEPKNHGFLIDVFFEIHKQNSNAYLVLVGDGVLRTQIEEKVAALGLSSKVVFLGLRKDVPLLMLSVFDIFVFPSLWEGLGLVAVEAQSAGLLCIASNNVPKEADVGSCVYLDLNKSLWVDNILNYKNKDKNLENERYSIEKSIDFLNKIYLQ